MQMPAVAIVADDLIWSTRLAQFVTAAGHRAVPVRSVPDLVEKLQDVASVIVDLTARAYDGIAAVEIARHSGHRVLCVAQHDDLELRKRALDAGAERVLAYRILFERGAGIVEKWLTATAPSAPSDNPAPGDDE